MNRRVITVSLAAAALSAALGANALAAGPSIVKMGSFTPPKARYLNKIVIPWLRKVEKDSGGTVKFQEFWGGALIRSPRKQWEGIMNGIQDAAIVIPAYTSKLFPDFTVFALPFLFRGTGSEEATAAGWKLYERGLLGGLDKVHVLAIYTNDNGGLHFNRTIKTLDGIKGLKVRVPGPEQAAVVKQLGLVPVGMGTPQVAESLNRGVIQGTLTGWSAINTFRITPLIKTHLDLPMGVRTFFIGMRKSVYEKLPRKGREAVDKNRGLDFSMALGRYYEKDGRDMRANTKNRNTIAISKGQRAELLQTFKPFHDKWVSKTKDGARKYKAMQEILAKLRGGS